MAARLLELVTAQNVVRGLRRRKKLPRLPRQLPPRPVERDYLHDVLILLSPALALVNDRLVHELKGLQLEAGIRDDEHRRSDAYSDRVDVIMDGVRLEYGRRVDPRRIRGAAQEAAGKAERFNREQVNRQFRQLLHVDVVGGDPMIEGMMRAFTQENVRLITSIPARYFDEIETTVLRTFRSGQRAEVAARLIQDRYDVSASRAALIARDQIGKFNGELNKVRQTSLGITRYIWRTSRDERVRESHQELEGEIFDWQGPDQPPEGHPGMPIQCRCTPEPYLGDLLAAL